MQIYGLQKMTLLDFPGKVACTVFLGGCNLRCPFCHNYDLATGAAAPVMSEEELLAFLEKRRGLLEGVAITGGEPCLNSGLPDLLSRIRSLGYPVKLDTNGCFPDRLSRLIQDGLLTYVAMDVKNSPERYAATCGLKSLDLAPVRESISVLLGGTVPYEFRTTVVKELHRPEDIEAISAWIHGADRYYLQAFTDRDTVPLAGFNAPDRDTMAAYREIAAAHVKAAALRGVD